MSTFSRSRIWHNRPVFNGCIRNCSTDFDSEGDDDVIENSSTWFVDYFLTHFDIVCILCSMTCCGFKLIDGK